MKQLSLLVAFLFAIPVLFAQERPINGLAESSAAYTLLKNATIIVSPTETIHHGCILISGDRIIKVGKMIDVPKGTVEIDLNGRYIIPGLIEVDGELGPNAQKKGTELLANRANPQQSATNWNPAVHPEIHAKDLYDNDSKSYSELQNMGFLFSLVHLKDGLLRGTGSFIAHGNEDPQKQLISPVASQHLSLEKGSSKDLYPSAQMGAIALIRQTFYDLDWYKKQNSYRNLSLDAMNSTKAPWFFEVGNYLELLRAVKISNEFNLPFNYISISGDEYQLGQQLDSIPGYITLRVNFLQPYDVSDPYVSKSIPLRELKHWEFAPKNPGYVAQKHPNFCISSNGCKSSNEFWSNIRKAIAHGLSPQQALEALTTNPARLLGLYNELGTLEKGKIASFSVFDKNPLTESAEIQAIWSQGKCVRNDMREDEAIVGKYELLLDSKYYPLSIEEKNGQVKGKLVAEIKNSTDKKGLAIKDSVTCDVKVQVSKNQVVLSFHMDNDHLKGLNQLHGQINSKLGILEGQATLSNGNWVQWSAVKKSKLSSEEPKKQTIQPDTTVGNPWFPNMAYGYDSLPTPTTTVFKNVTIWTNSEAGIIRDGAVIVQNGKIKFVGTGSYATPNGAKEIDGTGMHLTSGIIDEHSHIALYRGVNEFGQYISSEVRLEDVLNPNDIDIYRQLSGGVTTSQLLHGSANPIGGQSAIIKLKWGVTPNNLLFKGAPGFIKFALGENVKQSNWGYSSRFPHSRMGVEQVYYDAFHRAQEYAKSKKQGDFRRDLELDAIQEILERKRFVTCHSYVQSEINMLMHVADSFGFKINTFTHILEGYKLADKMREHGVAASTFSDWWAYKFEVNDAIPYNASLLHEQGVLVAINSDDAEMGRRLNQEAAKAIKYGGMSEEDAWKMVTLNPAKILHIDDRVGSIQVGKDADLVLWTSNPLSISAKAHKTMVDGVIYYDAEQNAMLEKRNDMERARILTKMSQAAQSGTKTRPFVFREQGHYHCNTLGEEMSTEGNTH